MKLDKELFLQIASQAATSSRLRKNFDLRDSDEEDGQRMLNVLCRGSKTPVHRHKDTSEVMICIYGTVIERYYNEDGIETQCFVVQSGGDLAGISIEKGQYHSLEAVSDYAVVFSAKAGRYKALAEEDIIM